MRHARRAHGAAARAVQPLAETAGMPQRMPAGRQRGSGRAHRYILQADDARHVGLGVAHSRHRVFQRRVGRLGASGVGRGRRVCRRVRNAERREARAIGGTMRTGRRVAAEEWEAEACAKVSVTHEGRRVLT